MRSRRANRHSVRSNEIRCGWLVHWRTSSAEVKSRCWPRPPATRFGKFRGFDSRMVDVGRDPAALGYASFAAGLASGVIRQHHHRIHVVGRRLLSGQRARLHAALPQLCGLKCLKENIIVQLRAGCFSAPCNDARRHPPSGSTTDRISASTCVERSDKIRHTYYILIMRIKLFSYYIGSCIILVSGLY